MGIRHLQTFMTTCVPAGYVEVSLVEECELYRSKNNGEKPTLVIDLMGIVQIPTKNRVDMLYGGRHGEYFKQIDRLFSRLGEIANLVFFEDGPVKDEKYDTWMDRQDKRYEETLAIFDQVNSGMSIESIVENSSYIPSITSTLQIIENRARAHGTRIVSVTKECDAELAQYACNNPSVIAVLADDTDFLIFKGNWRYLSINQLDEETLMTKEFSRTALRNYLQLNDKQLMVLATIAGNDLMSYDMVRDCHYHKFGGHRADIKFPNIARLIREEVDLRDFGRLCYNLADFLLRDTRETAIQLVQQSISQYNVRFNPVDHSQTDELLDFCRTNFYNFIYSVLQGMTNNLTYAYFDMRRTDWPDIFAVSKKALDRKLGIILQHRRINENDEAIQLPLYAKPYADEGYQLLHTTPEYPEVTVPPLLELLNRETFPEHDNLRFELLKWTLSFPQETVDLSTIPVDYLIHILTLYHMVHEGFITVEEADLILLSVKHVVLDIVPEQIEHPSAVDGRAFRIAFLLIRSFSTVSRAMKTSGLKDFATFNKFDGLLFHKFYNDWKHSNFDPSPLLRDLNSFRIYA